MASVADGCDSRLYTVHYRWCLARDDHGQRGSSPAPAAQCSPNSPSQRDRKLVKGFSSQEANSCHSLYMAFPPLHPCRSPARADHFHRSSRSTSYCQTQIISQAFCLFTRLSASFCTRLFFIHHYPSHDAAFGSYHTRYVCSTRVPLQTRKNAFGSC